MLKRLLKKDSSAVLTGIGASAIIALFIARNIQYAITSNTPFALRGKTIQLVNACDEDVDHLTALLPCWLGEDIAVRRIKAVTFPCDEMRSSAHAAQKDASDAFVEHGKNGPCLVLRTFCTIGGTEDFDYVGSLVDLARRCEGQSMSVTCVAALALSADRMVVHKATMKGVVCSPTIIKSRPASDKGKVSDLFLPNEYSSLFPLHSDLYSKLVSCDRVLRREGDDTANLSHPARWEKSQIVAKSHPAAANSLLLQPIVWRAILDLAEDIRYGELRRLTTPITGQLVRQFGNFWRSIASLFRSRKESPGTLRIGNQNSDDPLHGRFENHVTVATRSKEELQRFKAFAEALAIKLVLIILPPGAAHQDQAMTSYYTTGTVQSCLLSLYELATFLAYSGFEVLRVKMELQMSADINRQTNLVTPGSRIGICPLDDVDAKDQQLMTHFQYFEFHVKVQIPDDRADEALDVVRTVALQHNSHLSRNAFKPHVESASAKHRLHFITLRLYKTGFGSCLKKLQLLCDDISKSLIPWDGTISAVMREFSVWDSNTGLDAGWLASP